MSDFNPFAACLRLNMVTISQADAEAALGVSIARFEPIGKSGQHYAQIDIECEQQPAIRITKAINAIGPKLRVLLEKKQVESAVLDMAAEFEDGESFVGVRVPAALAAATGGFGIDVEVSVYLTDEDDE